MRPAPYENEGKGLCFLTGQGRPWVRVNANEPETGTVGYVAMDSLAPEIAKLLHKLKINGRKGLGFYTLRHCFETQAGESRDQVAVDSIMGHVDSSMAANYRHRISDDRLRDVVAVVHDWLFSAVPEKEGGAA